ncbi:hypothetical protein GOODEAATRI_012599, partial [Goodea atripinnis]
RVVGVREPGVLLRKNRSNQIKRKQIQITSVSVSSSSSEGNPPGNTNCREERHFLNSFCLNPLSLE